MTKTPKILIIIALLGIGLVAYFYLIPQGGQIEGVISEINLTTRTITLISRNGVVNIILTPDTKLKDENNLPTFLSSFYRTFKIKARGMFSDKNTFVPTEIRVIHAPNIIIVNPDPYSTVKPTFVVKGKVKSSKNSLKIRILDYTTKEPILETDANIINNPDQYNDFQKEIHIDTQNFLSIILEAFYVSENNQENDRTSMEIYVNPHLSS